MLQKGLLFIRFLGCFTSQSTHSNQFELAKLSLQVRPLMLQRCAAKMLELPFLTLLNVHVQLVIVLDFCNLFDALSTGRNAIDRSILSDGIRYKFESKIADCNIWVPGKVNQADVCTKLNIALKQTFQIILSNWTFLFPSLRLSLEPLNSSQGKLTLSTGT